MVDPELKNKLTKSLDFLKTELTQIRTGRASPAFVEGLVVDAYGAKMTIKELSSITALDSQTLSIAPWDKTLIKDIAKAISDSDLKINPVVDGNGIRVPFPALTEERRKEFAKLVSVKVEEAKNSIRNVRQEAMKEIDKLFNDKAIGEDDKFTRKDEVEKLVKEFIAKTDEIGEDKKSEIMKIG